MLFSSSLESEALDLLDHSVSALGQSSFFSNKTLLRRPEMGQVHQLEEHHHLTRAATDVRRMRGSA
jgi:hypothetical protein